MNIIIYDIIISHIKIWSALLCIVCLICASFKSVSILLKSWNLKCFSGIHTIKSLAFTQYNSIQKLDICLLWMDWYGWIDLPCPSISPFHHSYLSLKLSGLTSNLLDGRISICVLSVDGCETPWCLCIVIILILLKNNISVFGFCELITVCGGLFAK